MELAAQAVLAALRRRGVTELYHANTVRTSCTFLRHGRLLARGVVDEWGLDQTAQQSDELDRRCGIWFDLFLDAVDIHHRAGWRNNYGPVLFVFDLELLAESGLSPLWVTRKNPQNWSDADAAADRYFPSIEEFERGYRHGDFDQMLVLRHQGGVLRLSRALKHLLVDDPRLEVDGIHLFSQAAGALRDAARAGGIPTVPVQRRACRPGCICANQYGAMRDEVVEKLFAP